MQKTSIEHPQTHNTSSKSCRKEKSKRYHLRNNNKKQIFVEKMSLISLTEITKGDQFQPFSPIPDEECFISAKNKLEHMDHIVRVAFRSITNKCTFFKKSNRAERRR